MSKYENLPKGFVEQSEFAGYESVAFASVKNMVEKASGSGSDTNKKQDDEIKAIKEDLEANYVKKGDIDGDGIITSDILDEKLQDYAQKTAVTAVEDAVEGKVSSDDFEAKTEALEAADREINERLDALTETDDSTLAVIRQINEALSANTSDDANTKEVLEAAISNKVDKAEYDAKVEELQSGITKNASDIAALDIPSVDGLATEQYVTDAIGALDIPSVDGLATEQYVDGKVEELESGITKNAEDIAAIDLTPYAKTETLEEYATVSAMETAVGELNGKISGNSDSIASLNETVSELPNREYVENVASLLDEKISANTDAINAIDLTPYAKTEDVDSVVEELQSGITENQNAIANLVIPSIDGLATQVSVDAKVDRIEYEQMVDELQSGITDNENAINVNANAIADLPTQAEVDAKVDKEVYDAKITELENRIRELNFSVNVSTPEAFTAALSDGGVVTLASNVDIQNTQAVVTGDTTIRLAGNSLSGAPGGNKSALVVSNGATLNIVGKGNIEATAGRCIQVSEGGSVVIDIEGTIKSDGNVAVEVGDGGSLTIDNANVESQENAVGLLSKNGTAIINGGTFDAVDNAVFAFNGSAGNSGNTLEINGGTFNGGITTPGYVACGVYVPCDGEVRINGGTFNITNGCGVCSRAGKTYVGSGATFNIVDNNPEGTTPGKVGDSRVVVPCAAFVFDGEAKYPSLSDDDMIIVSNAATVNLSGVSAMTEYTTTEEPVIDRIIFTD